MKHSRRIDFAVLGAVLHEVQNLDALLTNRSVDEVAGGVFTIGEFQDHSILIGATGIGKVNAAISAAALLANYDIGQVWNVGCAGCFEQGELTVGDVLITKLFLCGDEGVLSTAGAQSMQQIGIPLLAKQDQIYFDSFPASPLVAELNEWLPAGRYGAGDGIFPMAGPMPVSNGWHAQMNSKMGGTFHLAYGTSLTVGMVSGDREVARQRYCQYGALAENMEGSAIAQTCLRFEKPFVECRGMSNIVGERNRRYWQMEKAIAHCQTIFLRWISRTGC